MTVPLSLDPQLDQKVVVVSVDGHVGPSTEQYRHYVPKKFLEDFDSYMNEMAASQGFVRGEEPLFPPRQMQELIDRVDGPEHNDMAFRIHHMDLDGVAAEVLFYGTHGIPIPWNGSFLSSPPVPDSNQTQLKMRAVGMHVYNQWLADAISIAPDRFVALAQVPLWDVDLAVEETLWAAEAGLRGINFWSPRRGIKPYEKPEWEPFWSACEANHMLLATHGGFVDHDNAMLHDSRIAPWLIEMEIAGWPCRRALHRMIFGGVFARHPQLNLMLTEQTGNWWSATVEEFDSVFLTNWRTMKRLGLPTDKQPSEYMGSNVYIGASCMAPFEAQRAIDEGYQRNICTGRDWPHVEGSWGGQPYVPDPSVRLWHLQLRYSMAHLNPEQVGLMAAGNAMRACHLDPEVLAKVTKTTNALTYAQIAEPLSAEEEPEICFDQPLDYEDRPVAGVLAFRKIGPWG